MHDPLSVISFVFLHFHFHLDLLMYLYLCICIVALAFASVFVCVFVFVFVFDNCNSGEQCSGRDQLGQVANWNRQAIHMRELHTIS